MVFSEHLELVTSKMEETLSIKNSFKKLNLKPNSKIFIVGSGSSFSHGIFLKHLLESIFPNQIQVVNPYTFVKYKIINSQDYIIHITQEAKRYDNICPIEFAKEQNAAVILFTSKLTEISYIANEVYLFAPEHSKLLVSLESYISAYVVLIMWANFQKEKIEKIDWEKVLLAVEVALKTEFNFVDQYTTFLYSSFAETVAVEGVLKINECLLQSAESYEIKHFSHGKHFVSYNKPWTFNIFYNQKDAELIEIYRNSIFEKHHQINYFESNLADELKIFEWAACMLKFIDTGMKSKLIQLENIPIRDKIRLPHNFKY